MSKNDLLATAAATIDRDVIVVANAGSGKTHLLVEHYFYLLSQGFSPDEMVAFTFTEKAALELKERILHTLPQHHFFKHLPQDTVEDWKQKILESPIGTIHQFCLRVIQDDPGPLKGISWEILEEGAEAQIREDVLRSFLESAFAKENPAAKRLLQHYGISTLLRVLRTLMREELLNEKEIDGDFPELLPQEKDLLNDLYSLTQILQENLKQKKFQRGRLSFFDLEQLALERIEKMGATGKGFLRHIRHLLVDEFQDTSPIQIKILEGLRKGPGKHHPILFCVGDPKQSIYRFRHVDQTLLEKTSAQILSDGGVQFDFTTNFRSSPALVGYVNEYTTLAFPKALPSSPLPEANNAGRVHWINLPQLAKKSTAEQFRTQEAQWVTSKIIHLNRSGIPLENIAILYRASASSRTIVKYLKSNGIPFTLRGGRSLWERQEILDLQNLLFFLDQPNHSMALLGLLRSPLFLISDQTLFWLTLDYQRKEPLWNFLIKQDKLPHQITLPEKHKFQWAIQQLKDFKTRFTTVKPGSLLEEIVETWDLRSLYGKIEGDMEPILAVEQFLTYLKQIEGDETMARLRQIKRTTIPLSPLGDVLESKSCVQLLTIHAAKGLEFPKVFLLDLDRPPPHPPQDIQRWGNLTALKLKQGNEWTESPLFNYLKGRHRDEENEENKRLLYVALTRAKDELFIPMTAKGLRKDNLKHLLCENINHLSPTPCQELDFYEPNRGQTISPMAPPAFEKIPKIIKKSKHMATVSELDNFHQCTLRHHYTYHEKISDQDWLPPGSPPDPSELGTLLHQVLHEWSFYPDKDLGEILFPLLAANPLWNRETLIAKLHDQLINYRNSPCYEVLRTTKDNYSELPFLLNFPGGWVRGQIDRLIKIDQHWQLIDFKSSQRRVTKEEFIRDYGFQLKTYALAASQFLHGEIPQVHIHVISPPRAIPLQFSPQDLQKHKILLDQLLQDIRQPRLAEEAFKSHCHQCPYWKKIPICPVPGRQGH